LKDPAFDFTSMIKLSNQKNRDEFTKKISEGLEEAKKQVDPALLEQRAYDSIKKE